MIVVQAPLRVSFLGGATDFEDFYSIDGGAVLSTTIDKYVFVILKERFDDNIYVNYSKKEIVGKVDDLKHDLVREAMRMTGVDKSVEITTLADVPSEGTGLGSSSSITVALLHALYTYKGELKTSKDLAKDACHIEIDILKKPIGKQDQYITAYGNLRFISFYNSGVEIEKITLSEQEKRKFNESLLLFYTGFVRKSTDILHEQKSNIKNRLSELRSLKELAIQGRELLLQREFGKFGELLHRNWELKKRLANNITNPEIEEFYQIACKAGALGGKVTGAGGGGFLLLYCPLVRQENVREALHGLRELPFNFEPDGCKVILNYRGAR